MADIPTEAVEAAARAIASDDGRDFDSGSDDDRAEWLDHAEMVLTAALPHLPQRVTPSVEPNPDAPIPLNVRQVYCVRGGTEADYDKAEERGGRFDNWLALVRDEARREVRSEIVADLRAKFGVTNRAADYIARAAEAGEGLVSFRDAAARLRALLSADDEAVSK